MDEPPLMPPGPAAGGHALRRTPASRPADAAVASGPSGVDDPEAAEQLLREQLALAADASWRSALPALLMVALVAFTAQGRAPIWVVAVWAAAEAAVLVWRALLARRLRLAMAPALLPSEALSAAQASPAGVAAAGDQASATDGRASRAAIGPQRSLASLHQVRRQLLASALVSGALVGATGPLFVHAYTDVQSMFLLLLAQGWITAAVAALGPYPRQFYLFVGPAAPLVAAPWLLTGTPAAMLIGALLLVFGLILAQLVRALGRTVERTVMIRLQKDREVQRANDAERRANELAAAARASADQAREAARLARDAERSKSRFLASASHDLKQPTTALGLLLDQLRERPLDDVSRHLATQAALAGRSMSELVSQLFDLARLDNGAERVMPSWFAVQSLFDGLAAVYGGAAERKGLAIELSGARGDLCTDPQLLGRALGNLIDNAIRYTSRGRIAVRFELVAGAQPGDPVRPAITVEDTGIGIEPALQQRVFEEFFQVDNSHRDRAKGLGVGLAIVRRIAMLLGAQLRLESAPRVGTRITFVLPPQTFAPAQDEIGAGGRGVVSEPSASFSGAGTGSTAYVAAHVDTAGGLSGPRTAPADAMLMQTEDAAPVIARILIVEDDPAVADALTLLLETWGHEVVTVADGEEATARLERERFGVLISDYRLPGTIDGLRICAFALQRDPGTARLLISGDTEPALAALAAHEGVRLLPKPLSAARVRSEFARLGLARRVRGD